MISEMPPPPDWLDSWARTFLVHAAPWFYWLLAFGHLVWWLVLRWQRRPGESKAAKGLRQFMGAKVLFWLSLALGRTVFGQWQIVGYAVAVIYVLISLGFGLWWTFRTYVPPAFRDDGKPPPVEGTVLPEPKGAEWEGGERRVKERRKNWPPKVGA